MICDKDMKVYFNHNNHKNNLLFVHGYLKDHSHWNISEYNKVIDIEKTLSKSCNTIILSFDYDDYEKTIMEVCDEIYYQINQYYGDNISKNNIMIVSHSYGSFYSFALSNKYPKIFNKLLLIEPTLKTQIYLDYMKKKNDSHSEWVINNFDSLPSGINIKAGVIVRIHINYTDSYPEEKLLCMDRITNKNIKSRIMIHPNKSHMLHYDIPGVIIDSIREVIKI